MEKNIIKYSENPRINDVINDMLVERHSYFQLKHFLIEKEPTIQSKLWRCIRELKARKDSIYSINLEIEEIEDCIEEIGNPTDNAFISDRRKKRKLLSLQKRKEDLIFKLKNLTEECDFIAKMFEELEKIEKIKPFDEKDEQIKYWDAKLLEEFNLKVLLGQPLDTELIKTILSLDDDSKIKNNITAMINNKIKLNLENRKQ